MDAIPREATLANWRKSRVNPEAALNGHSMLLGRQREPAMVIHARLRIKEAARGRSHSSHEWLTTILDRIWVGACNKNALTCFCCNF